VGDLAHRPSSAPACLLEQRRCVLGAGQDCGPQEPVTVFVSHTPYDTCDVTVGLARPLLYT